jgi:hypothetical protein
MVMSEPPAPAEDGRARPGAMRRWRQHSLFWPGVIVMPYLVVTLGVAAVEYFSEMSKLSRGFYTDTFSPFFYTHILTFPTSALHSDWPGYPEVFNRVQWEGIVQHAVGPVVLTVVIQAALLAAGILLLVDQTEDRR